MTRPSNETDRVLSLPRHAPFPVEEAIAWCDANVYATPGAMRVRPVQALALYTLHKTGGLVAPIGVGHGKSLIMYLAPIATGARNAVFMMPPALVPNFEREVAKYKAAGFRDVQYHIVPYSTLSRPDATELLDKLQPDLIVADEAHNLRNRTAARTLRFLRYMRSRQQTVFVPLSGTFFDRSLMDAAHLFGLGLREGSPLPAFGPHLDMWSRVLDPAGEPTETDIKYFEYIAKRLGYPDDFRLAVHRRVIETQGVVSTDTASLPGVELRLRAVGPRRIPAVCYEASARIAAERTSPDGSVAYDSPGHLGAARKAAMNGYWLAWDWPSGQRDEDWVQAKRDWSRLCLRELEQRSAAGYDSPALVFERALATRDVHSQLYAAAYAWAHEMHKPEPPRRAVWLDKYLVDWVVAYARAATSPVIIWYSSDAMEQALREAGFEVFGKGTDLHGPARTLAASIRVHGEGRNLQDWHHALVVEPPQSPQRWEQLLGRMHRPGQTAPYVQYDICTHVQSMDDVFEGARFLQEVQGQPQKLLEATWVPEGPEHAV